MDVRSQLRRLFGKFGLSSLIRPINFTLNKLSKLNRLTLRKAKFIDTLIFYLDPQIGHPGLADRLKAIVSCYYIAKENGLQFKIIFNYPFELKQYLEPNQVDWTCDEQDLRFSLINSCIFNYEGFYRRMKKNKQYICFNYTGSLITPPSQALIENNNKWVKDLWNQLFKPSNILTKAIENQGYEPQTYIAIHLRFINAFEHFEKCYKSSLSEDQRKNLLKRCRNGIIKVCDSNRGKTVLVFSDSAFFLQNIKDLPIYTLDIENISHIRYTKNSDSVLKTFIDFMMISRASAVYRIISPEMHKTNYSLFAAQIGNVPFFDIEV